MRKKYYLLTVLILVSAFVVAGVQQFQSTMAGIPSLEITVNDSELMVEAKTLASDAEAVAVGKLYEAIAYAQETGDEESLWGAVQVFKENNADQEADQTAKVNTSGWVTFSGGKAGVCATEFAPAIYTYDGRYTQMAEVYEQTTYTVGEMLYQDITGLPNGTYKVAFYANAFYTSGRGFDSPMEEGAEDVAYVFANDQKAFITAHIATSTSDNDYRQFDVEVTDGTIHLGMGKEQAGTNWHTMQIAQLTWFTTAKSLYAEAQVELAAAIAEAQTEMADATKTQGREGLQAHLDAASDAVGSNMYNVREVQDLTNELKNAIVEFQMVNASLFDGVAYVKDAITGKFISAGHNWGTRAIVAETGLDLTFISYPGIGKVAINTRVSNGGDSEYLGEGLYMDAVAFNWTLKATTNGYYISNGEQYISVDAEDNLVLSDTPREWMIIPDYAMWQQLFEVDSEVGKDATWLLQDPDFGRNNMRVSAWAVSDDCTNWTMGRPNENLSNYCSESYHSTFTISQMVQGAPAGVYALTAQGFYRQDGGVEENVPVFFANDKKVSVPVKTGEENSLTDAAMAFENGNYTIEPIWFEVGGDGVLNVGIQGFGNSQWVCFDNFRLTYYGTEKEIPQVINTYNVTFKTDADWADVYAYVWSGEGVDKLLGEWPGTQLTKNAETGLYEVTLMAEIAPEKIIFNNGAGEQTEDLVFEAGKTYDFTTGTLVPQMFTTTFTTNRGWENVYAYAWRNGADGSVTEFLGEWPGMAIAADSANVYTLTIEAFDAPQYIIFNNGQGGVGNQTADLTFENGKAYEYNAVETVGIEPGQIYYLFNEGSGMFFSAGNDWQTRASVAEEGQRVYFENVDDSGNYILMNYVPNKGAFYRAFAESTDGIWTDNASQPYVYWKITKQGDSYLISNADVEPDLYLGWNGDTADTRLYLIDSQDANVLWKLYTINDYENYLNRLQILRLAEELKVLIDRAQEIGLGVNYELSVYQNENVTIGELQDCINSLQGRLNNIASGKNPVDVTKNYIVNQSYENDNNDGWSGTTPGFQSYQNAEFWNKNYDMYQYLSGLAPGVYKLGLQAFYRPGLIADAYQSWLAGTNLNAEMYVELEGERTSLPIMNAYDGSGLVGLGGGERWLTNVEPIRYIPDNMRGAQSYFDAGRYQNNLFFVVSDSCTVRIGLNKSELIQSDWTMFDNWTLTYYGNGDDSYLAWIQAVADAAPTFDGITVTQSVLNDYLAVRNAPVASNKAEAEAYVDQLNALKAAVQENSALWSQYENLVTEGQTLASQLKEEGKTNSQEYEDLNDYATGSFSAGEYGDEYAPNGSASYILNAHVLDNAMLRAEIAYLNKLMDDAKYLAPIEGEDVTRYLVNADFSEGQTGWMGWKSATSGGNAGISPITGGSPNICAEAYDANNFDLYQEVTGNVNVGVYEISVQGFTRIGRNDGYPKGMAWSQFRETDGKQKMPVYVYFNDNATNFKDIHEEPQTTGFYSDLNTYDIDVLSNEGYYSQFEYDEELCFPNTFTGASYAFARDMYVNSAFGAVMNQGDPIRVGIKGSTNGQNWAAFDNVKLTFWGTRADKVLLALQAGIADVEALNAGRVGKNVVERIANALAVAKNAAEEQSNDGEAMFATLGELYAAKSAVQASQELMDQLAAANDSLRDYIVNIGLENLMTEANDFCMGIATRLAENDINDDEVSDLIAQIRAYNNDVALFAELRYWQDMLYMAAPTDEELESGQVSYDWYTAWDELVAELEMRMNPEDGDEAMTIAEVLTYIDQIQLMLDIKYSENILALGDVNGNGEVTTTDAVMAVSFALEKNEPTEAQFKAADVDKSNNITVSDVVGIVNIALEIVFEEDSLAAGARMDMGYNYLTQNGKALSLTNTMSFVGFQMDVTLAEGAQFNGVQRTERTAGLLVDYNRVGDNTWRIVGVSLQNSAISGSEGDLLKLDITGDNTINVTNIEFTDLTAHAYKIDFVNETTGIKQVNGSNATVIYNVNGVRNNTMQKGMNIIRHEDGKVKKVFVK